MPSNGTAEQRPVLELKGVGGEGQSAQKEGLSSHGTGSRIYNGHSWPRPPRPCSCQVSPCGSAEPPGAGPGCHIAAE